MKQMQESGQPVLNIHRGAVPFQGQRFISYADSKEVIKCCCSGGSTTLSSTAQSFQTEMFAARGALSNPEPATSAVASSASEAIFDACQGSIQFFYHFYLIHRQGVGLEKPTAHDMFESRLRLSHAYSWLAKACRGKRWARYHLELSLDICLYAFLGGVSPGLGVGDDLDPHPSRPYYRNGRRFRREDL